MRDPATSMAQFCAAILLWMSLSFQPAFAQDGAQDGAQTSAVEIAAPAIAQEAAQPIIQAPQEQIASAIDLNDAALKEALEARAVADQAIIDALQAQQAAAAQETGLAQEADAPKKSFIPTSPDEIKALATSLSETIIGWLTSVSFLAQIGAIILAYFIAPFLAKSAKKRIFFLRAPPGPDVKLKPVRDRVYALTPFLRTIFLVALLATFAVVLKAVPVAGQDWLVKLAQGLVVVFLIYSIIKTSIQDPLLKKLATWIVIPLALLAVFGYFDNLIDGLNGATLMQMGDTPITAMTLVRLAIFGALFFWLGNLSNTKGQEAIRSQETLDAGVREIVAKMFQILLFIILVVLVMSFAGIPLSGLVVIFSAVGLGIGFGLQPIAANFISGMIILFDRSVKVGDFVNMEDDHFGRVKAINMRSTTVATADGIDIIIPNTSFTENAYENWTHDSPLQRYEVDFTVAYKTDLDALVPIIHKAVLAHEDVLSEPDEPSVEFRAFTDNGIHMCVEFWAEGIDDGPNKFTSDVGFILLRTLREHNIEIPYPQRVVYQKK